MSFFSRLFHQLYVGGYNLAKFLFDITTLICLLGGIIVVPTYILFKIGGPFLMLLGFVIIPFTWLVSLIIAISFEFHLLLAVEIGLLIGAGLGYLFNKGLKRYLRDPIEKRSSPWEINDQESQAPQ